MTWQLWIIGGWFVLNILFGIYGALTTEYSWERQELAKGVVANVVLTALLVWGALS